MFGFFKKKSGEVPEEQERLQKAAAREAERKEAPAIPEELRALGQKFLPEEFSILAVTGAGGFGGSRPQENGPWLAVLELTAWKEEDSEEPAHREKTQLVALADDKLMEYLRRRVRGDSVFQIMVRPSEDGKQFLMTELPQPEIDPEMKAILEEQKKPVSIWVPELGTFTLNRLVNWFEAEVEWLGQPARLDIDREEDWDACVEQAKALMADQKGWDEKVRAFAAQELLDQANDWAQDAAERGRGARGDHPGAVHGAPGAGRRPDLRRRALRVLVQRRGPVLGPRHPCDRGPGSGAGDGTDGGVSGREVSAGTTGG